MTSCSIKTPNEDDIDRIIQEQFTNEFTEGYYDADGEGTYMATYYAKYADAIKNFAIEDSDVIVSSYPKTGTTWTQEMVWLIGNNCDYEGAKVNLKERFPFIEFCSIFDLEKLDKWTGIESPAFLKNTVEFTKTLPHPRFIKTHLPFNLLPDEIKNGKKSPKIIYVMRNPKDTCVSFYHHGRIIQGWTADFENFCKVFLSEKIMYGSFWKHILGYWNQRNNMSNLLIITYEDMKKDHPSVIKKVASFLGKSLTDEQIEKLAKHLSFESMRNNEAVNYEDIVDVKRKNNLVPKDGTFIRAGQVGKYKEEMSQEIIEKFNAWSKNCVANTGFDKEYNNYVV